MSLRIIAGQFKGRILKSPKGTSTRPTQSMVRESIFNICQNRTEGASFLDLFAGSGAMGLEALSRGAKQATFVEKNRMAAAVIRENIAALQVGSQTMVMQCDAKTAIERLSTPFDILYIDPPYDIAAAPFVEMLLRRSLIAMNGYLFIEERSHPARAAASFDSLTWIDTRRFGEALLHQYLFLGVQK
jgi:16S rRNA (guanine966-N2)-methyltransferase